MYRKTTLENGVRVVTHADPRLRSCALGVLIDAGPRDEPADRAGLAHLAEHLMFEGTGSRTGLEVARLIDTLGGQVGGFVTRDYTCYAATVLDEYVPYAIDLFGDLLLNSTFPEECVAAQRGTVGRELAALADQPDRVVNDRLKAFAWPDHPLGRPVAGLPETVAALTREDVIYFTGGAYLPDRIIVAAAGGVDHDDFTAQVRDAFWRLLGGAGPRELPHPVFRPGVTVAAHPLNQAYFALAVQAPHYASPDRYGWHLLTTVLGGGISSRLFRRVREDRGLAFHIAAEYHAYADAGLLVVEGGTAAEDLHQVVGLAWDELRRLADGTEPVTDDELWRAKMQLRGQYLLGGQDASTLFSRIATQELYFGQPVAGDAILAAIEAVDTAALEAHAAGALAAAVRRPVVAVVGPDDPGPAETRIRDIVAPVARAPAGRRAGPSVPLSQEVSRVGGSEDQEELDRVAEEG